jgi:hypothetical protein
MSKSYEAVIEGKKRRVLGFDEAGKNLYLDKGQRYAFERLNFTPPGAPDEPSGDIFGWPLLEAVRLQPWQGDWKWNDENETLCAWVEAQFKAQNKHPDSPEYFKRAVVKATLNGVRASLQGQIRGVVWFKHDDGADGWNTPVLLKSFRALPVNTDAEVAAESSKGKIPRTARSVTRFENDFSIAKILQKNGEDISVTVEQELRNLIKTIINAGGSTPRTQLRTGKGDTWQPEKLLTSKAAISLINAGLLGKRKTGRTVTYWAKEQAE